MKTWWYMRAAAASLAIAALGGCSPKESKKEPGPTVTDAWVRLPAVLGRPGAAYAKVIGRNDFGVKLTGVSSPKAARGELHLNVVENGRITGMRPIANAPVFEKTTMFLQPLGAHVMLFGLAEDLKPGDTIPLTFRFDDAPAVTVDAKLVGAGDPAP